MSGLTCHHLPARSGRTRSLVVLLHGFGANGRAMLGLGQTLAAALPDTVFVAPDAPDPVSGRPGGRMWYRIPELDGSGATDAERHLQASARRLDLFLDDLLASHGLPAQRLALVGFSQGAGMAYEVGPRRSDQLAGVVAIAGRMKRKDTLVAEARSKPPFLVLTGVDDHLLTSDETALTAKILAQADIPLTRVLMATGHDLLPEGIDAARVFLRQCLYAGPVDVATTDALHPPGA